MTDQPSSEPREVTIQVKAPSLSYAMDKALLSISSAEVEVLEITDAGLKVGDTYLVTALVVDRTPFSVR